MTPPAPWESLELPVIAAPMTGVSGPDLVVASCAAGIVGSFPTHNADSIAELNSWLEAISAALAGRSNAGPVAVNLIVHHSNHRLDAELECLALHRPPIVITSVGSPAAVSDRVHSWGASMFVDVATLRHVDRAIASGADGLVLLCSGAGGQTGTANPLAFVRAVRERFDGPIALAGGICDGRTLWAATVAGADLGYMGTRFISTAESLASCAFKEALITATLDDIVTTDRLSGLPANFLREWLVANDAMPDGGAFRRDVLLEHGEAWSAGHSVTGVTRELAVADLVAELSDEYRAAQAATASLLLAAARPTETERN